MVAMNGEETHFLSEEFSQGLAYKLRQNGGKKTAFMREDEESAIKAEGEETVVKTEGVKTTIKKVRRRKGSSRAGNSLQNQQSSNISSSHDLDKH